MHSGQTLVQIDILTLFPGMFEGVLNTSMAWKARDRGLLHIAVHDIRAYTTDRHRTVDDTPYGGGGGMVLRPDVVVRAVEAVLARAEPGTTPAVILTTPQGRLLSHAVSVELSRLPHLVFICGHYEGIDDRVRQLVVTDEISIGDYVLTGGELAAMVIIDAVMRHIPGVLGAEGAADRDSHADGVLEGPQYTRPPVFRGLAVPEVLLHGDHGAVRAWQRAQGLRRTWQRRPDLLRTASLSEDERYLLATFANEDAARRQQQDVHAAPPQPPN
jgi:tRNA (guanine37-N1)-methyltransferase